MKSVSSYLRNKFNVAIIFYIDDVLIFGPHVEEVAIAIRDTAQTLERLGFLINREKSDFLPRQTIVFLGVEINSFF